MADKNKTFTEKLPGTWLSEEVHENGEGRPIRPDLPWLRNLSWTKIHAMQLGAAFGIMVFFGQLWGFRGSVFGLAVSVAQFVISDQNVKSKRTSCQKRLGATDIRQKPWYFLSAALFVWAGIALVLGPP